MEQNLTPNVLNNMSILLELDAQMARKLAPVTAYMIIVMVTGLVGNGIVCYIHGTKMKKSTANSFILWLAVLDLVTCVFGLPMEMYDLAIHYTLDSPTLCSVFRFTVYLTIITAVTTLLFIAVDRYCKICRPLKKPPIRRCRIVVIVSLLFGVLLSWPALILFGKKRIKTPYPGIYGVDCSINDAMIGTLLPKIYLIILFSAFFIGAVTLVVLYSLIGCALYRRSKFVIGEFVSSGVFRKSKKTQSEKSPACIASNKSRHTSAISSPAVDKRYKLGRTGLIFLTITLVFILSFVPSLAIMTVRTVKKGFEARLSDTGYVLYCFGLRTYFINNATNCLIYGFLNPIFRKECVQLCRRWKACVMNICCCYGRKQSLDRKASNSTRSENLTEDSLQHI